MTVPDPSLLDPVPHARALIRCPSVTPHEGGALDYLQGVLSAAGFVCHRLVFSEPGAADVDNLYARIGSGAPHLCFAGHTDVVPPGDEAAWRHPPFAAAIDAGNLHGRGACDMKGAVACFLAAALRHLSAHDGLPRGSISLLVTGDEEGPAVNGTRKVLDWMRDHGHIPDHCLLGEPTNDGALGEAIKIGRRGSYSVTLTVTGVQGHVAYPDQFRNPLTGLVAALARLKAEPLDVGSAHFAPSNLEVSSIDTGNPTHNVVPARTAARLNIRFNDRHSADSLARWLEDRVTAALDGSGLTHHLADESISECFHTEPGPWVATLADAIRAVTGRTPHFSTAGGTSDGRFINAHCPVVEFGLCNATIHQVDERVPLADLATLTAIYEAFLERYFAAAGWAGERAG